MKSLYRDDLKPTGAREFWHCEITGEPDPWKRAGEGRTGFKFNPSKDYQMRFAWSVKAALPSLKPGAAAFYGVRLRFFSAYPQPGDIDNLTKNVLDALNKNVWRDDRLVKSLFVVGPLGSLRPRTELLIFPLTVNDLAEWSDKPDGEQKAERRDDAARGQECNRVRNSHNVRKVR